MKSAHYAKCPTSALFSVETISLHHIIATAWPPSQFKTLVNSPPPGTASATGQQARTTLPSKNADTSSPNPCLANHQNANRPIQRISYILHQNLTNAVNSELVILFTSHYAIQHRRGLSPAFWECHPRCRFSHQLPSNWLRVLGILAINVARKVTVVSFMLDVWWPFSEKTYRVNSKLQWW
jgi:hypothetical protein